MSVPEIKGRLIKKNKCIECVTLSKKIVCIIQRVFFSVVVYLKMILLYLVK
jgi:hypothetical protein